MSDQQNRTTHVDPGQASEPPVFPLLPWCVAKIKRKLQERRAKREKETSEQRSARITANATRVIASFAIIAALVGISQAIIANRQLTAMQGQLDVMGADQRPWIRPDFSDFKSMTVAGSAGGLQVSFDLKFTNIGKNPAFSVLKYQELVRGDQNLIPEHDALCRKTETIAAAWKNPIVIFPNESSELPVGLNSLSAPVATLQWDANNKNVPPSPAFLSPTILGCVVYKSGTDPKIHHTWYAWGIWRRDQAGNVSRILPEPEMIPGNQLFTIESVFHMSAGRNYAD